MQVGFVVFAVLAVASALQNAPTSKRSITAAFENAMARKVREIADGDQAVEEMLNEVKKRYVEAFDETLEENIRLVRQVLNDRRRKRSLDNAEYVVKRAFDTMEDRIHEKAVRSLAIQTRGIKDFFRKVKKKLGKIGKWVKGHFGHFSSWMKKIVGHVYKHVEPTLGVIKTMAMQLIKGGAADLSQTAKREAKKFFDEHSDGLKGNLKEKVEDVLG